MADATARGEIATSTRATRRAIAIALGVALLGAACSGTDDGASTPTTSTTTEAAESPTGTDTPDAADTEPIEIVDEGAWLMHPIDGRFRGANALGPADVNGDGHTDYVTNYEFDQRWVVSLHPGDDGDVRAAWPTVEIWRPDPLAQGNGKNPESTALGDFDGDGNVDAAGAHGFSDLVDLEGSAPGVHVVWGPGPDDADDPDAWTDGGWIPATEDLGHPLWAWAHDVNGDGLTDITYGGRRHGGGGGYDNPDSESGNGTFTGLAWLEAPADPAERRDLDRWTLHHIDADQTSGHGFVFADLDGDGDDDVVDANADFDTPEEAEELVWYENPGDGTEAQLDEWAKTTLLRSPDFFAKPSVAVGDVDGDGLPDVVTQVRDAVLAFRQTGRDPVTFEQVTLPKPPEAEWTGRGVRLADIDRDGDLDLLGMLVHEDGVLPPAKASVHLWLQEGDPWSAEGWRPLPVKWGPGQTMKVPGFGEKWDQVDVTDVDGDGDLDVVANNEEWWVEDDGEVVPYFADGVDPSSVAVVWFENRLGEAPFSYEERDGMVVLEAERPSEIGDSTWVERAPVRADPAGRGGPAAVQAHNALEPDGGAISFADTEGLRYDVDVAGGRYVAWARVLVPASWGYEQGGDASDSAWLSLDGDPVVLGDAPGGETDAWTWVRADGARALEPGAHRLDLRVREHGVAVDRIVLTTDADPPEGAGPSPTFAGSGASARS